MLRQNIAIVPILFMEPFVEKLFYNRLPGILALTIFFTIQLMFIEVLLKIKILAYKYTEISGGEVPIHNKENSINKTNIQHPYYLVF